METVEAIVKALAAYIPVYELGKEGWRTIEEQIMNTSRMVSGKHLDEAKQYAEDHIAISARTQSKEMDKKILAAMAELSASAALMNQVPAMVNNIRGLEAQVKLNRKDLFEFKQSSVNRFVS